VPEHPDRRSATRRRVFAAAALLIALTIAELLCRLVATLLAGIAPAGAAAPLAADAAWSEYQAAGYDYQPFALWRHREFSGDHVAFDAAGRRRTVNPSLSRAGARRVRIAFFGGSTIAGLGVDDAHTIPSLVSAILARRHPDIAFDAENLGVGAYVSSQDVIAFWRAIWLGEESWDLAVFYEGANDGWVSFWRTPGGHNYDELIDARLRYRDESRSLREVVHGVARELSEQDAIWLLRLPCRALSRWTAPAPIARPTPDDRVEIAARVWTGNLRLLDALCRERDIGALLVLQPVAALGERIDEATLARLHALSSRDHFRRLYAMVRTATGVLADDFSAILDGREDVWLDWCHLNAAGNALVAAALADRVEARLCERGRIDRPGDE